MIDVYTFSFVSHEALANYIAQNLIKICCYNAKKCFIHQISSRRRDVDMCKAVLECWMCTSCRTCWALWGASGRRSCYSRSLGGRTFRCKACRRDTACGRTVQIRREAFVSWGLESSLADSSWSCSLALSKHRPWSTLAHRLFPRDDHQDDTLDLGSLFRRLACRRPRRDHTLMDVGSGNPPFSVHSSSLEIQSMTWWQRGDLCRLTNTQKFLFLLQGILTTRMSKCQEANEMWFASEARIKPTGICVNEDSFFGVVDELHDKKRMT